MIVVLSAMLCMGFASIIGGATGFGTALIATPLMLLAGVDVTEIVVVNMLPGQYLKPAAGVLTVLCGLAMALPSSPNPKPPSRATNIAVGTVGGYFSTTTSRNGPPVVLLLSRAKLPPMSFIGDLAGYFVITNTLSLALLWAYTDVQPIAMWPMIVGCIVIALLGNVFGMWIARRLPVKAFRSGVIALVVIAGALTILSA